MRYEVIAAQSIEELSDLVQRLFNQGWALQGGVSAVAVHQQYENERKGGTESSTDWSFYQAMTLRTAVPNEGPPFRSDRPFRG